VCQMAYPTLHRRLPQLGLYRTLLSLSARLLNCVARQWQLFRGSGASSAVGGDRQNITFIRSPGIQHKVLEPFEAALGLSATALAVLGTGAL
jgi:hypothetical protein